MSAKPTSVAGTDASTTAPPRPTPARTPPARVTVTGPKRTVAASSASLVTAIATEKHANASAAIPAPDPTDSFR